MSDQCQGSITLYGVFPAEHLDELIQQIEDDGLGDDYGSDALQDTIEIRAYIEQCAANPKNKGLFLCGTSGSGEFDLFEKCVEWGVNFSAHYESGYEWMAGRRRVHDGVETSCLADNDGNPVAALWELRKFHEHGMIQALMDMLSFAGEHDLPPFEIQGRLARAAATVAEGKS